MVVSQRELEMRPGVYRRDVKTIMFEIERKILRDRHE
jgi:hypothetical protein